MCQCQGRTGGDEGSIRLCAWICYHLYFGLMTLAPTQAAASIQTYGVHRRPRPSIPCNHMYICYTPPEFINMLCFAGFIDSPTPNMLCFAEYIHSPTLNTLLAVMAQALGGAMANRTLFAPAQLPGKPAQTQHPVPPPPQGAPPIRDSSNAVPYVPPPCICLFLRPIRGTQYGHSIRTSVPKAGVHSCPYFTFTSMYCC